MKGITLITFLALSSIAMTKKDAANSTAQTSVKIVNLLSKDILLKQSVVDTTKVRLQAEKYFKDVFVEATFKDPYSYKLLKTVVEPITLEKDLKDSLVIKTRLISVSDTTNSSIYKLYKTWYAKSLKEVVAEDKKKNKSNKYAEKVKTAERDKRNLDRAKEDYTSAVEGKARISKALLSLNNDERSAIVHYKIYIDCHANNSYGNAILGRYVFPYKLDVGVLSEPVKYN